MKKLIYAVTICGVLAGIFVVFLLKHHKLQEVPQQSKNYYSVSDETAGIAFNVSKRFSNISREELLRLNPSYLYGYRDDKKPSVACFVSQTTITKQGKITADYLKDGTFNAVKKSYPTAELGSWGPVKGKSGVFLDISYTNQGEKIDQPELVLVDTKNTTFGFCQTPSIDNPNYESDFTIFFSSLKLN